MIRKIDIMHKRYGILSGVHCADCNHCLMFDYHGKRYYKCELYGISNSEATDWRIGWFACGLYGAIISVDNWEPVMEQIKHQSHDTQPLEGQLEIGDMME